MRISLLFSIPKHNLNSSIGWRRQNRVDSHIDCKYQTKKKGTDFDLTSTDHWLSLKKPTDYNFLGLLELEQEPSQYSNQILNVQRRRLEFFKSLNIKIV